MAVNTTELKLIYDEFLTKGLAKLIALQEDTQMEDEHLATASANIVIGAMANSIKVIEVTKRNELTDEQIVTEGKKAELADKDKLIKDQQELSARLQNGGIKYDYTYFVELDQEVIDGDKELGDVKSKTLVDGGGISIYELQQEKVKADTLFVIEQTKQLGFSVVYNNRIKALENYSDTIGNLGIGGFIISSDMWNTYFKMINEIYINSGDNPVDSTITTPTSTVVVKA